MLQLDFMDKPKSTSVLKLNWHCPIWLKPLWLSRAPYRNILESYRRNPNLLHAMEMFFSTASEMSEVPDISNVIMVGFVMTLWV